VLDNLSLEVVQLHSIVLYLPFLANNLQELRGAQVLLHRLDILIDSGREIVQIFEGFNSKVLGRRSVVLDTL
jgi:hypothetical protein